MKAKEGFILRTVAGEQVILPLGENIRIFNGSVILNEVSTFIWKKLSEADHSFEELLDLILSEYDVSRERAGEDLRRLLTEFSAHGLICD